MKKLLIHIGTPKTGTSSIQASLLAAQRQGALRSVCYPDFSWARKKTATNPHGFLGYLYRQHNPPRVFKHKPNEIKSVLEAYKPEFRKELAQYVQSNDNIILSAEYLSPLTRGDIVLFKKDLGQFSFDDVVIVIYVRNPAHTYLSITYQKLKASSTIRDPRTYKYKFKRIISLWSKMFDGKIIVRPFDRAQLHQHCVVQDFVKVSSEFFGQELGKIESTETNVSLSAEGIVIMQQYRNAFYPDADSVHKPDSNRLVRILTESQKTIPQTRPKLRKEVADLITGTHRESLEWLRSEYGIDYLSGVNGGAEQWAPRHDRLELSDVMECNDETVQQLLLYALRTVLSDSARPRQRQRQKQKQKQKQLRKRKGFFARLGLDGVFRAHRSNSTGGA